jgi:hypothetical protein
MIDGATEAEPSPPDAANSDEAEAIGDNGYGMVYVLRFSLTTAHAAARILTAWIVRHEEDFPRLITCYIV